MSVRIGSLFSGIGGLELAVEMATGGRTVFQAEPDDFCRNVLAKHWPGITAELRFRNVEKITQALDVEILCGGFPCQDISSAGHRVGIGGARSGLWSEFDRIIRLLRPPIVFVENVAALSRRGLDRVLGDLAASGYDAEWSSLRAADVGAPHRRRRLFILAHRSDRPGDLDRVHRAIVAHTNGLALGRPAHDHRDWHDELGYYADRRDAYPPPPRSDAWARWTGAAPGVRRGAYGNTRGLDAYRRRERCRVIGNAVSPSQGREAFRALIARATLRRSSAP